MFSTSSLSVQASCNSLASNVEPASLEILRKTSRHNYTIFLAYSQSEHKYFLIKVFPIKKHVHPFYEREIRIADLSHPNIQSILSYSPKSSLFPMSNDSPTSYIVLEKPTIGDLYSLIVHGKLPEDDKLTRMFFLQIFSAVQYIHSEGIAHLDLRLENIYLDHDFHIKLGNFIMSQKTGEKCLVEAGSDVYRAPEGKLGDFPDPMAADIYSLGMILFIIRFQIFPYMIEQVNESFWKSMIKKSEKPDEILAFKDLFTAMTKRSPEERISLKGIKAHHWLKGPVYQQKELKELMNCLSN